MIFWRAVASLAGQSHADICYPAILPQFRLLLSFNTTIRLSSFTGQQALNIPWYYDTHHLDTANIAQTISMLCYAKSFYKDATNPPLLYEIVSSDVNDRVGCSSSTG